MTAVSRTALRREHEKEARRNQILDAARHLFSEQGYYATTIDQLAEASMLSVGTLYLYFKSKEELYVSLFFEGQKLFAEHLRAIFASPDSPRDKVHAVWEYFLAFYRQHPGTYHVLTFLSSPGVADAISDEVRQRILHDTGSNFELLSKIITLCINAGIYRQVAPGKVADLLWSSFLGFVQLQETRDRLGLTVNEGEIAASHAQILDWLEDGLLSSTVITPTGSMPLIQGK